MNDELLLSRMYHRLFHDPSLAQTAGCVYSDASIAFAHFLAKQQNRSMLWASDQHNWPICYRRVRLPGYSQIMRRLKTASIQALLRRLEAEFRAALPDSREKICDGKPLVVGGFSKDHDARTGKVPGGFARGYRLHLIIDSLSGAIEAFEVTPLDVGEPTVMRRLVQRSDASLLQNAILRGDSNYDSNRLYRAVAARHGRLIAPRKKPGRGLGHHRHHADRLRAVHELERAPDAAQRLREHKRRRVRVEQSLAHLTNVPFGLWALPNHVRGLRRVREWVRSKIVLYHLYRSLSQGNAVAA